MSVKRQKALPVHLTVTRPLRDLRHIANRSLTFKQPVWASNQRAVAKKSTT
jgi:hypothetical protein